MIEATAREQKLPRTLGLWSAVALVVGITIGSGIFRSPAGIAQKVPSPTLMIALWVARRADHVVRRAVAGRACRSTAGDGRLLRLPARRMGAADGVSLRLGGADSDPRLGARRHRRRLRRIPAAQPRHRPGRALRGRAGAVGRRHRLCRHAPTSSAPTSAPLSSACRRWRSSRRWCVLVGASFVLGGGHGASFSHLTAPAAGAADRRRHRARARQRALGLRRLGRPVVCRRRGEESAAEPAAGDHPRHAGAHRHLRPDQPRLPLRQPDRVDCRSAERRWSPPTR